MKIHHKPKQMQNFSIYIQYHDWTILHKHTFWEFALITKGPIIHKINGLTKQIETNTLCLMRPNDCHAIHNLSNCTSEHIGFKVSCETFENIINLICPSFLQSMLSSNQPLEIVFSSQQVNAIKILTDKILIANKETYNSQCAFLFIKLIKPFIIDFQSHQVQMVNNTANLLIQYLNDPKNFNKNLYDIASEINYSYSHLNRIFKQETGISPSKYLKKQRMIYASKLLTETDMTLEDIAYQVGYSSCPHFIVAFKKEFQTSPYAYRKDLNNYLEENI